MKPVIECCVSVQSVIQSQLSVSPDCPCVTEGIVIYIYSLVIFIDTIGGLVQRVDTTDDMRRVDK